MGSRDETAGGGWYGPGGEGAGLVLMGAQSLTVLVTVTVTAGAQAAIQVSWCSARIVTNGLTLVLSGNDSAGERSNREELEAEHVDSFN